MKNKVKEYRTETGMSVAELARRAKTSRQTIHAIEKVIGKTFQDL